MAKSALHGAGSRDRRSTEGHGATSDGALEVNHADPRGELRRTWRRHEPGGALTAVGFASCLESALAVIGRRKDQDTQDAAIDSSVSLLPTGDGGFKLAVGLDVTLPRSKTPSWPPSSCAPRTRCVATDARSATTGRGVHLTAAAPKNAPRDPRDRQRGTGCARARACAGSRAGSFGRWPASRRGSCAAHRGCPPNPRTGSGTVDVGRLEPPAGDLARPVVDPQVPGLGVAEVPLQRERLGPS